VPARRKSRPDIPDSTRTALADGEWVLAIVELARAGQATAAAARARCNDGDITLAFEPRDWARIQGLTSSVPETDRSPVRNSSSPPASSHLRKLGEAGGARILLVDDDAAVRDVVSAMLEAVGFEIVTAQSAEEALELLAKERIQVAVLDWTLPGMSGLELCRTIRARWARLPVLFLTAHTTSADVVDAFAGGADDYVIKPFRAPELGARIFGLLRRAADAEP